MAISSALFCNWGFIAAIGGFYTPSKIFCLRGYTINRRVYLLPAEPTDISSTSHFQDVSQRTDVNPYGLWNLNESTRQIITRICKPRVPLMSEWKYSRNSYTRFPTNFIIYCKCTMYNGHSCEISKIVRAIRLKWLWIISGGTCSEYSQRNILKTYLRKYSCDPPWRTSSEDYRIIVVYLF